MLPLMIIITVCAKVATAAVFTAGSATRLGYYVPKLSEEIHHLIMMHRYSQTAIIRVSL